MTKELKNLYESLIDQIVIDGIIDNYKGDDKDELIKLFAKDVPLEKRRMVALAAIEEHNKENRKLHSALYRKIKENQNDNYSRMAYVKTIVRMLREYVKVGKEEVKTHGEVFTPIELVEQMLDTLPMEVWSNPNLKWLDPCNGVGIFPAVIVERLMKGLSKVIPDQKKRYQHIVENMLHVCELQHKNLFLHLCAFDPKDIYAMNVYCGSYLDEGFDKHAEEVWGVEKFDIIVANPPYQEQKIGNKKTQPLWDKFVIKILSQLVDAGYLVAVHPDNWRGFGRGFEKVREVLKSKQILSLEIHNKYDGHKTFGASTTYDFYCLHNVEPTMFTKIVCQDGTIERVDISNMDYIPNGMFEVFENLLAKDGEESVDLIANSSYHHQRPHMSKEKTDEFIYPCVYTTSKDGDIKLWYSNTNQNGHFGISKVIFSNGISQPIIDNNGDYGLTEFAFGIVDESKNLPFIKRAMENPNFIEFMGFMDGKTGTGHRYNYRAIALFRKNFWEEFQPA